MQGSEERVDLGRNGSRVEQGGDEPVHSFDRAGKDVQGTEWYACQVDNDVLEFDGD